MGNKKNFVLNCDVCDSRKMKEEDYADYERILINTDLLIVNSASKSILNRLPATINQDTTLEIEGDEEITIKSVNGSYEISGDTVVAQHTVLVVNGSLCIHPGTEKALESYQKIVVNGSVRCPNSLESYLAKLSINGSLSIYPDNCVLLDSTFVLDRYFPLRAREGTRYYAEDMIVIRDQTVDLEKLSAKNVQFLTKRLLVPENLVEKCVPLFDEQVDFAVVPDGMSLVFGDTVLDQHLAEKEGDCLYVYGSVSLSPDCDMQALLRTLKKLVVTGNVTIKKEQEDAFRKLDAEYEKLEFRWEGRILENKVSVRVDKSLLENSPSGVLVQNAAKVKISKDLSPKLLLDRLKICNCAKVQCSEEQESAVAAISENVAQIGNSQEGEMPGIMDFVTGVLSSKMVNADSYVL